MGEPFQLGRYSLHAELASGGMATVYLARLNGPIGFGRTVAIKRLHPHLARDPEFVAMFLDEARLAARIQHPNVVPTLDVVASERELFLVMEYVRGESLGTVIRSSRKAGKRVPVPIGARVIIDMLSGLHAAHEAVNERGEPLDIVHRDVSPQNVMVGADGVSRVLDFGVAKAASRMQTTRDGRLKGKIPYMPPEQIAGEKVTRRTDVYSAGVVLWEALTSSRLFTGDSEAQVLNKILTAEVAPPSSINPDVSSELDAVVLKALRKDARERYATARELAEALDACVRPASAMQVAEYLDGVVGPSLAARGKIVAEIESGASVPGGDAMQLVAEASSPSVVSGLSTASHVVQSNPSQPKTSRGPLFALAGAGAIIVGLLVFIAFNAGRSSNPTTTNAPTATTATSATSAAPPAPSEPIVVDSGAVATVVDAGKPHVPVKPTLTRPPTKPDPGPKPTSTTPNVNDLIDTRN